MWNDLFMICLSLETKGKVMCRPSFSSLTGSGPKQDEEVLCVWSGLHRVILGRRLWPAA